MKKKSLYLLLLLLFLTLTSKSQNTRKDFYSIYVSNYVNKELIIDTSTNATSEIYYQSFYDYFQDYVNGDKLNVSYPDNAKPGLTKIDSIINKRFKVLGVIDSRANTIKKIDTLRSEIIFFILSDLKNGKNIYFKYSWKDSSRFPFLINSANKTKYSPCNDIDIYSEKDEFTNEITYSLANPSSQNIQIYQYKKNSIIDYGLYLTIDAYTVNVGIKGVYILFEDGTKFFKNSKIDVSVGSNGMYTYSSFVHLTQSQIALFTKRIKKVRLYIYDQEIDSTTSDEIVAFLKCRMKKK